MTVADPPITLPEHRQSEGAHLVARSYVRGTRLGAHMHREAQLVYAAKGTMQVTTPRGCWLLPPDRAVWVPPKLEHSIDVLADIDMRTLYFDAEWLVLDAHSAELKAEFVVRVTPLLQQLILACFDGRDDSSRTLLLIQLILRELHRADDAATFIPLPLEPRCRRAAQLVLDDPTRSYEIEDLAREVGTSARTLSRLFSTETQFSFKSWSQRARISWAAHRLSTSPSTSVKQIATELNYASVPAFSQAFRQIIGRTPSEFAANATVG